MSHVTRYPIGSTFGSETSPFAMQGPGDRWAKRLRPLETLNRNFDTDDADFSTDLDEFDEIARSVRDEESM